LTRFLVLAALALLSIPVFVPGAAIAAGTVDLDRPGALEALQQSHPVHSAR